MPKDLVKTINIMRYAHGEITETQDLVLYEAHYELYVNDSLVASLICTDTYLKELIIGHLYSIGAISAAEQIREIDIEDSTRRIRVKVSLASTFKTEVTEITPKVDCEALVNVFAQFNQQSELFISTGAVHSAALLDKDYAVLFFAEDMGRHNAVDKAIGWGLAHNVNFSSTILMTSSRMPLELIRKAGNAGIDFVASISAPTLQSIEFARAHNITLIGMFRKGRMNLYHIKEAL